MKSGTKSKKPAKAKVSAEQLLQFHRSMALGRRFEEKVIELFREGELPGFIHVAIGQEAIATGVGEALDDGDFIGSTHRAHAHILARGSDPFALMAELMGRSAGVCAGKGGSMHLADMSKNVVGANGIVGAGLPMMNGVAWAQKELDTGKIAVAFYGDGATNQGNVHEAMNLAQLWKLPVLFVLENNRYAESTPLVQQVPIEDLSLRGAAYGMKTIKVDGNDVLEVYQQTLKAAEFARSGQGPVLIVAETWRLEGHYVGDSEGYRPKGEAKEWRKKHDPINRFEALMSEHGIQESQISDIWSSVEQEMDDVVARARAAELPAGSDAMQHVYAEFPYDGPVRLLPNR